LAGRLSHIKQLLFGRSLIDIPGKIHFSTFFVSIHTFAKNWLEMAWLGITRNIHPISAWPIWKTRPNSGSGPAAPLSPIHWFFISW
jgi:hypothetical protein